MRRYKPSLTPWNAAWWPPATHAPFWKVARTRLGKRRPASTQRCSSCRRRSATSDRWELAALFYWSASSCAANKRIVGQVQQRCCLAVRPLHLQRRTETTLSSRAALRLGRSIRRSNDADTRRGRLTFYHNSFSEREREREIERERERERTTAKQCRARRAIEMVVNSCALLFVAIRQPPPFNHI